MSLEKVWQTGMKGRELIQNTDLTLIRYCGHFLIKAEGGAKNFKRDLTVYR